MGRLVVPLLQRLDPDLTLVPLVRDPSRCNGLAQAAVPADLRLPGLGLDRAVRRDLAGRVTEILHIAADLRFGIDREESAAVNVGATAELLRFARECPRLEKFGHVSTTYIMGKQNGVLPESEFPHKSGYWNVYQETKHGAEHLAYEAMADLPVSVFRLSSMIGSAADGRVRQFNYFHQLLRLLPSNPFERIAADPGARIDLVADDWSAASLAHLFGRAFLPGETYQIAAGAGRSWTVRELVLEAAEAMEVPAARLPEMVGSCEIARSSGGLFRFLDGPRQELYRSLELFFPHLTMRQEFAVARTHALLEDAGLTCPHIGDFYGDVLRYCLASRWGRIEPANGWQRTSVRAAAG